MAVDAGVTVGASIGVTVGLRVDRITVGSGVGAGVDGMVDEQAHRTSTAHQRNNLWIILIWPFCVSPYKFSTR
jgi:hypothetical protein